MSLYPENSGIESSKIQEVLKEVLEPVVQKAYNESSELLSRFLSSGEGVGTSPSGGRHVRVAAELNPGASFASTPEGGEIARSTAPKYMESLVPLRQFTASQEITDFARAITNDPIKAIQSTKVTDAYARAGQGAARGTNRSAWLDAEGYITSIDNVDDSVAGEWTFEVADERVWRSAWLVVNEFVQFGSDDPSSVDESIVYIITRASYRNRLVTVERAPGSGSSSDPADGDFIYANDTAGRGVNGLRGAIDNSADDTYAFQNVTPGDYDEWAALNEDATGEDLSSALIDNVLAELSYSSSAKYIGPNADKALLLTTRDQKKVLFEEITDNVRFTDPSNTNPSGNNFGDVTLPSGHTLTESAEAPDNTVYVLNTSDIEKAEADGGWKTIDGQPWQRIPRHTKVEVQMIYFMNLKFKLRNRIGRIHSLNAAS